MFVADTAAFSWPEQEVVDQLWVIYGPWRDLLKKVNSYFCFIFIF